MLTRNSSETIGDLSRDLPACSAESHPPTLVGVDGTFCVRSHLMTYIHTHTHTHTRSRTALDEGVREFCEYKLVYFYGGGGQNCLVLS